MLPEADRASVMKEASASAARSLEERNARHRDRILASFFPEASGCDDVTLCQVAGIPGRLRF